MRLIPSLNEALDGPVGCMLAFLLSALTLAASVVVLAGAVYFVVWLFTGLFA